MHGYAELTRKVKFFGGNSIGAISSTISGDEVVQRDSATSAGEDEINEDGHDRAGPVPSQGRTMLRRRRQFDAQGNYFINVTHKMIEIYIHFFSKNYNSNFYIKKLNIFI